jgi:stress-induced morphogen
MAAEYSQVASMACVQAEAIREVLARAFPDAVELDVLDRTGGGDHFLVTLTTPEFDRLPLIDQHRSVNEALAEPLADGRIHELRIRTKGTA